MQKLSKAEAGKLGAERTKVVVEQKKQARIAKYDLDPKCCKQCNTKLDYACKHKTFCSSSCAARFNNLKRSEKVNEAAKSNPLIKPRVQVQWNCINCGKEHTTVSWRLGKFCNVTCQQEKYFELRVEEWLKNNVTPGKGVIKKYLANIQGYHCSVCGITEWNNKQIVLELEHKDGNAENNAIDNLCLICPNCHSQTPSFKGRNKGNGRHARRQRYKEGKSY